MLVRCSSPVSAAEASAATVPVTGGAIQVEFADGSFDLPRKVLLDRIAQSACAVSTYYGRFPAPKYRMLIVPISGQHGVLGGTTWGFGGAHSRILIGEHVTVAELRADWIMTHEMVHGVSDDAARASLDRGGHRDLRRALARSWIGDYPPEGCGPIWFRDSPGMPESDDRGLDRTPTWGRTYWGGAMFCTIADVQIRKRTNNQRGLIDALREF